MARSKDASEPSQPETLAREIERLEDEIEKRPGVPKTPAGWWTFGLTIMAILIAVALWLSYR